MILTTIVYINYISKLNFPKKKFTATANTRWRSKQKCTHMRKRPMMAPFLVVVSGCISWRPKTNRIDSYFAMPSCWFTIWTPARATGVIDVRILCHDLQYYYRYYRWFAILLQLSVHNIEEHLLNYCRYNDFSSLQEVHGCFGRAKDEQPAPQVQHRPIPARQNVASQNGQLAPTRDLAHSTRFSPLSGIWGVANTAWSGASYIWRCTWSQGYAKFEIIVSIKVVIKYDSSQISRSQTVADHAD